MFWTFLLLSGMALVFVQLGAYSVWVMLLAVGLKVTLFIIAALVIALLWRKVFAKNS